MLGLQPSCYLGEDKFQVKFSSRWCHWARLLELRIPPSKQAFFKTIETSINQRITRHFTAYHRNFNGDPTQWSIVVISIGCTQMHVIARLYFSTSVTFFFLFLKWLNSATSLIFTPSPIDVSLYIFCTMYNDLTKRNNKQTNSLTLIQPKHAGFV